jgi:hypothetical protein
VDRFGTTEGPVADNVRQQWERAWELSEDSYFRSVCRSGFRLTWDVKWSTPPDPAAAMRKLTGEQYEAFKSEHERLLEQAVIRWVRSADEPPSPGDEDEHLQPIFAIQQGDRWRQIWNMKYTNAQLKPRPFRMTGVKALRELIQQGDWMCSIDIKDAYANILMAEEDCKYQRYVLDGQVWELRTLPFGMAQAPWAFTKFLDPLLKKWRREHGITVMAWLDDIVMVCPNRQKLVDALQAILDDLSTVGLKINTKPGKSTLVPTQQLVWCGIEWSTLSAMMRIPIKRLRNVEESVEHAVHTFGYVLSSLAAAMPRGQLLRVLVEQDNASVVSYIRKQGGSKRSLALVVEMTLKWAFQHNIMLLARWIPGLEMAADEWSRAKALEDRGDWCIRQEAFEWVCKTLNVRPEMDLFASRLNNKCDRYYSFRRDPRAMDFDALSADKNWAQVAEVCYAAPPEHLVGKVLGKITRDKALVLLVCPLWEGAYWWTTLEQMTVRKTLLPMNLDTVLVGHGQDPTKAWKPPIAVAALVTAPAAAQMLRDQHCRAS